MPPSAYDKQMDKRIFKLKDLLQPEHLWLQTPERAKLNEGEAVCISTVLAARRLDPGTNMCPTPPPCSLRPWHPLLLSPSPSPPPPPPSPPPPSPSPPPPSPSPPPPSPSPLPPPLRRVLRARV